VTTKTIDSGQDYAIIATTDDGRVRVLAARTTRLAEEARRRHQASPTAAAALGRALSGAALLGLTLKDRGTVTLRLIGDGPLGGIIAEADASGRVRGYAKHPEADLPPTPAGKLDVGGLVGQDGFCYVTRDMGLKAPYTGSSPLVSGEIGEDLTRYLYDSEQTPSAVALGVLVGPPGRVVAAGGLFVQIMPGSEEEDTAKRAGSGSGEPGGDRPRRDADQAAVARRLEETIGGIKSVSRLIEKGLRPEDLVRRVLDGSGVPHTVHEARPLRFQCRCSRERAIRTLASLRREDLDEIIASGEGARLVCHFCGEAYRFTGEELKELPTDARG
jgi:molecular chaperone Hsp33